MGFKGTSSKGTITFYREVKGGIRKRTVVTNADKTSCLKLCKSKRKVSKVTIHTSIAKRYARVKLKKGEKIWMFSGYPDSRYPYTVQIKRIK